LHKKPNEKTDCCELECIEDLDIPQEIDVSQHKRPLTISQSQVKEVHVTEDEQLKKEFNAKVDA
jgi:hypothetical protein